MGAGLCFRLLVVFMILTSGYPNERASTSTGVAGMQLRHKRSGQDFNSNTGICHVSNWTYDFAQSELSAQINYRRFLLPDVGHIKDMLNNVRKMLPAFEQQQRAVCGQKERRWEDYVKAECSKLGGSTSSELPSDNSAVTALTTAQPFWPRGCKNLLRDRKKWWGWPVLPCEEFPKTLTRFVAHCASKASHTHTSYMTASGFSTLAQFFSALLDAVRVIPASAFANTTASGAGDAVQLILDVRKKLTVADTSALAELFPYLPRLKTFHVINTPVPAAATRRIVERLGDLKHLEFLNLHSSAMDDEGVEKFTQSFAHFNKSMKKLCLEGNSITSVGGAIIARNIAKLQALEELVLGGYSRVAGSVLDMAKAFLKMPKLCRAFLYALATTAAELPEVERQVRETIHLLKAQVFGVNGWVIARDKLLYDATHTENTDLKWEKVRREIRQDLNGRPGVFIESGNRDPKLSVHFQVHCSDCSD
ncbi:E3 ubiquitin-protein ligase rad18 [Branchiostoma belcheri]|nr:E3 ubiquitin-protein ligase rad18 [Branchiostoma belcheri]